MTRAAAAVVAACVASLALTPAGAATATATAAATATASRLKVRDQARAQAREILGQRRFHATAFPHPLRSVFEAIGNGVERLVAALARPAPGGSPAAAVVLALIVLAAAAGGARTLMRRRSVRRVQRPGSPEAPRRLDDPAALERAAERAERDGELELALRLRFRAGLLALERAGVVALVPSLTTGALARRLDSTDFDGLAQTFDSVVYGRRPPRANDVEASRAGWERVLAQAAPR